MGKTRRRMLIVDGYNVLRSGYRYRHIVAPDYTDDTFNTAREMLLKDVISFAGRTYQAYIVYDGGGNEFSTGEPQVVSGVKVVFSPAGSSADKVIEKLAHDASARGIETLVITSDATIQDTVFGGGVDRMSANGFSHEMEMLAHEVELDEKPAVSEKRTVAERLDPETVRKLKALRDGR
ncbi:MAG: NYN domain-containing protein [Eggerthellaceae bacterium]|jgi:predicted RNA-binding protein with PIN domain